MCGPQGQIFRVTDESDGSELVRYDYISHGDEQRLSDVQTRFNGALHYTYTEQGWLSSGATMARHTSTCAMTMKAG